MKPFALICILALLFMALPAAAADQQVLFRDGFADRPELKKHSIYSIENDTGKHVLKAESSASASAIVYKDSFNDYGHSRVKWRGR